MRVAWLTGMAVAALAASPVQGDEWSHQYPLKGRPNVVVKTDDGSVRVETHDAAEVRAQVTTRGWSIEPGGVTITESQSGDRVQIEVRLPQMRMDWGLHNHSVEVVLKVPKESDLDIKTGDGGVHVQPVSGRLSVSTGDGGITAEGLQGEIRLHTGDGGIRASGLSGRLHADTGDGRMSVQGRFEALDLSTGDGGIDVELEPGSRAATPWSLTSGDGGITLRVPEDFGAELDAHTGDGRIVLETPVSVSGKVSSSKVRGTLGAGGQPLKIHTGDGSIRVARP
jgi:hypothetical protein